MSAKRSPVSYAESTLGVHDVYRKAMHAQERIEKNLRAIAQLSKATRQLRQEIEDREIELTMSERASNAGMSQTAFEKYMKEVINKDQQLVKLRDQLRAELFNHDLVESEARVAENELRLQTARMHELGGLLEFYAAAKLNTASKATQQGSDEDD